MRHGRIISPTGLAIHEAAARATSHFSSFEPTSLICRDARPEIKMTCDQSHKRGVQGIPRCGRAHPEEGL